MSQRRSSNASQASKTKRRSSTKSQDFVVKSNPNISYEQASKNYKEAKKNTFAANAAFAKVHEEYMKGLRTTVDLNNNIIELVRRQERKIFPLLGRKKMLKKKKNLEAQLDKAEKSYDQTKKEWDKASNKRDKARLEEREAHTYLKKHYEAYPGHEWSRYKK